MRTSIESPCKSRGRTLVLATFAIGAGHGRRGVVVSATRSRAAPPQFWGPRGGAAHRRADAEVALLALGDAGRRRPTPTPSAIAGRAVAARHRPHRQAGPGPPAARADARRQLSIGTARTREPLDDAATGRTRCASPTATGASSCCSRATSADSASSTRDGEQVDVLPCPRLGPVIAQYLGDVGVAASTRRRGTLALRGELPWRPRARGFYTPRPSAAAARSRRASAALAAPDRRAAILRAHAIHRHHQPEGRRRQNDDRRQPERRAGRQRAARRADRSRPAGARVAPPGPGAAPRGAEHLRRAHRRPAAGRSVAAGRAEPVGRRRRTSTWPPPRSSWPASWAAS